MPSIDSWLDEPTSPFWGNVISLDDYIIEIEEKALSTTSKEEVLRYEKKLTSLKTTRDGEKFVLERDNEPDLSFQGSLLASVSSKGRSRDTGRWTKLSLYKTKSGKYVCEEIGLSQWEGERSRHRALVVELESDVQEFFGYGWLSKELYAEVGIEAVEMVD